jgi:hypothetical protein
MTKCAVNTFSTEMTVPEWLWVSLHSEEHVAGYESRTPSMRQQSPSP